MPGVGKSRLVWEVTHSHRTHGWLTVQAGSVSYGKTTPYLSAINLLKGYFQIEDPDDQRKIREKVTGKLLTLDRTLESHLTALLALLDVPIDDAQWHALDPTQRRRRTLDALKDLLIRESQVQPLLVVIEDLHWIDSETQALVDGLLEGLPTSRMLLLVNYRPEYAHAWGGKTYYAQLRLDPLPPENAGELLDALLGTGQILGPVKRWLIDRTGGNPFFLEECVQTLVETRALVGGRGAYQAARPVDTLQVPATVQTMLAARIDRLPPEGKRLLQCAAVIGKDVPRPLLHDIADEPDDVLRSGLAHLQGSEFLYETRLYPDPEYTFKHALTHDVAYASLLQERRRALHARIVHSIETRYPDRLTEQAERLAHHAVSGELWMKAVAYLRQAGAKALARSANLGATTHFEGALAALRHLPESRDTLEQTIDIRLGLRNAIAPLGQLRRTLEVLREAEVAAERLGDERRLARLWGFIGNLLCFQGRMAEADVLSRRALAAGEALGDLSISLQANNNLGLVRYAAGEYQQAEAFFATNTHLIPPGQAHDHFGMALLPAVLSLAQVAFTQARRGAFEDGIRNGEAALAMAEELGHPYSICFACWSLGDLHGVRGDVDRAKASLGRARSLVEELTLRLAVPVALTLGRVYALEGRGTDALSVLDVPNTAMDGQEGLQTLTALRLGDAYLAAGRPEEASETATRALCLAREQGERGHEAGALHLLGEIASHPETSNLEMAETHYRDACTLANELGMRPLVAHCHLGLGKLYRGTGDRAKAEQHLTTAATLYREMGMNFWLEKAEEALQASG